MSTYQMSRKKKFAIIRALLCGSMEPEEVMRAHDIRQHMDALESDVAAFVYRSGKDRIYIVINQNMSLEVQQEVFLHELCHVIEDIPRIGYVLGLDGYRSPLEKRADLFVREVAATFAAK